MQLSAAMLCATEGANGKVFRLSSHSSQVTSRWGSVWSAALMLGHFVAPSKLLLKGVKDALHMPAWVAWQSEHGSGSVEARGVHRPKILSSSACESLLRSFMALI